ncbi:hypothetical protein PLICRDRAFT_637359 [Plicaturopsis crispa FD-325 SS-3]|nr:hypothetical protein PLICRDRAFT_637359 [Plicaturopsis crispa FD-325 SS-3]
MDSDLLSNIQTLSYPHKNSLKKGGIESTSDLLLTAPQEIAKKCRIPLQEVHSILDIVCSASGPNPRVLESVEREGSEKFTTGDALLDKALGGGIRTGMIWEIAGESAAGKSQVALQLSLLVQIPPRLGGIHGSACYLTMTSKLPTVRLVQLIDTHPLLSPSFCNMSDVHTLSATTIPMLLYVLSKTLPQFIEGAAKQPNTKPVKLVVLDALAELFHSSPKTTTQTLVERARNLAEISLLLHTLASKFQVAILVLNEVTDVFQRGADVDTASDLVYSDQSRWFNRACSIPGEDRKEAALGLVWANQLNARIMLSRTGRRRYIDDPVQRLGKYRKTVGGSEDAATSSQAQAVAQFEEQATLIRRLSVVFSSVAPPASIDFIITVAGLTSLPEDESVAALPSIPRPSAPPAPAFAPVQVMGMEDVSPLDAGAIEDGIALDATDDLDDAAEEAAPDEDEWEAYWKDDTIPEEAYNSVDLDDVLGSATANG